MENLSLSEIIQHNPDLLNIDSFLNQILSKITFEQFIAEIISFPNIYDLVSNKQEFWKQYYMDHHGPSGKSSQNVNWFFENFFKTKYYFTKGSSKNVATSITNILDPKYPINGGMEISEKNLLPISDVKDIILMDYNSYFLLNDGRLFELKNKEQKLITDDVKKILFRTSFDSGGGNGFIIILKNSGILWKYGTVPSVGSPSERSRYQLYELIFDKEENILDINNINNNNYSFSIRTKTETLVVTSLENDNDINIRYRLSIQSPIYSIIQRDMHNDVFTYCVFYTNDEISFFILSTIHDNIISFKRKLNMKINSLDIAYVPSNTYLLQIVESFDDIDVNYYWINLSDIMFWKPTMFQDQTEYQQLVSEKFFPLLTRGKIESEKLIMDKNSDMGIKYIKINTMQYNDIVDNLYAIDKQDNIYEFNRAKEFFPIPSGRKFFSGLGYLKEKIPKINRIFLSPISSYGFGQILELEYKTILIHKMHFLYHTIMKQINKEQFSPDQKTVTYSLINSPYVFFANMM